MKVLQVEDDPFTAKSVEMMLQSEGYACDTTSYGEQAVELAQRNAYDVIRPRVRPYTGTVDHDLPLYWADLLMGNPASGHFVR